LIKATVTKVEVGRLGDRVCVDLCSIMQRGGDLLVCVYLSPVHYCYTLVLCALDSGMFSAVWFKRIPGT
jgi:hypothetical protein